MKRASRREPPPAGDEQRGVPAFLQQSAQTHVHHLPERGARRRGGQGGEQGQHLVQLQRRDGGRPVQQRVHPPAVPQRGGRQGEEVRGVRGLGVLGGPVRRVLQVPEGAEGGDNGEGQDIKNDVNVCRRALPRSRDRACIEISSSSWSDRKAHLPAIPVSSYHYLLFNSYRSVAPKSPAEPIPSRKVISQFSLRSYTYSSCLSFFISS